ncbi:transmembrane protein [Legionella geestiana]|uniref:Transmembrane protein n=1 Tax=Legionella geestiana TaxID=45065 RepID=A0A0W0TU82_9GAMM|nr:PH domain-containing protein [Legionella geestiana]KTC99299.1 transmembrane protein [Legionella geestiana]QBS11987.1 PH domain-containing protein [Legionella geestiana]QDQ40403.1 PH domain-containing protein [Legionella geestiana]STX53299.1 transmembrane protein [Legionella geestiana]
MSDENTVYVAKLHKILFFWPTALIVASILIGSSYPSFREAALMMVAIGALWAMMMWVTWRFSSLTILKKQVVLRSGMLVRKTVDIPYSKIETMDIRQSVMGSLLRYGTLVITGTGGTHHTLDYLANPLVCRRHIEQMMHE